MGKVVGVLLVKQPLKHSVLESGELLCREAKSTRPCCRLPKSQCGEEAPAAFSALTGAGNLKGRTF